MTKNIDTVFREIGKRVVKARTQRGWTQEKLADKSDVGVAHIGFIEQGRRRPTLVTLHKIAQALGVTLEELFKGL